MNGLPHNLAPALVGLVLIALVVRRNLRSRQLKMDRMLYFPGILLLITIFEFAQDPPHELLPIAILAAAAAIGGLIGWQRGRLTRITHDPQTGALTAQSSLAGVILILVVFAVRFALRFWFMDAPSGTHGHTAILVTNALLASTVGILGVQRIEMYLRCRRILAEARGATPA